MASTASTTLSPRSPAVTGQRGGSGDRPRARRGRDGYDPREVAFAVACLTPALVVIGLFVVYPLLATGWLSLTSWDGVSPVKEFIGLDNYRQLADDPAARNSFVVTALYGAGVTVFGIVSGLGIALLLNRAVRGRGVYRSVFFLPVVTSSIAVAGVWKYLFDNGGPVNQWLGSVGVTGPNWLGDPELALVALTVLTVWKQLGLNVVLYLTALQALPGQVYEAAAVDGAGAWQRLRHITLPLLAPMTFFVVVQSLVTTFQSFELVYALTQGGPLGGTEVLGFLVYSEAFAQGEFGYAASIAFAGFGLVFAVTWMQWKLGGASRSVS